MSDDQLPRLGLFLLAPLLACALITFNAVSHVVAANERIIVDEAVNGFTRQAADVLDALQSERASAAVILTASESSSRQQYRQRWSETDGLIADILGPSPALAPSSRFAEAATADLQAALADLDVLREQTMAETIALDDAVEGYTGVITAFTAAIAAEFETRQVGSPHFAEAFLAITKLHERFAIEVGTGLTAFYDGRIETEAHQVFIEAAAPQDHLAGRFSALAGPQWRARLEDTLAPGEGPQLAAARDAIIRAGYRPDRTVDQDLRAWWREARLPVYFALGDLRNRYAEDGLRADIRAAQADRARVARNALLQILALLLAGAASVYGLALFVRPSAQPSRA